MRALLLPHVGLLMPLAVHWPTGPISEARAVKGMLASNEEEG